MYIFGGCDRLCTHPTEWPLLLPIQVLLLLLLALLILLLPLLLREDLGLKAVLRGQHRNLARHVEAVEVEAVMDALVNGRREADEAGHSSVELRGPWRGIVGACFGGHGGRLAGWWKLGINGEVEVGPGKSWVADAVGSAGLATWRRTLKGEVVVVIDRSIEDTSHREGEKTSSRAKGVNSPRTWYQGQAD